MTSSHVAVGHHYTMLCPPRGWGGGGGGGRTSAPPGVFPHQGAAGGGGGGGGGGISLVAAADFPIQGLSSALLKTCHWQCRMTGIPMYLILFSIPQFLMHTMSASFIYVIACLHCPVKCLTP